MRRLAGGWIVGLLLLTHAARGDGPRVLSLDGSGWTVRQADKPESVAAAVPGCVHTDLLAAGKIADPFVRDNAAAVQWVGQAGWAYARHFDCPADVASRKHVVLHCDGLDTLATVAVNGTVVGRSSNMFRSAEFDVRGIVRGGGNAVEVRFDPVGPYLKAHLSQPAYPGLAAPGSSSLRKEPCNFGWDFAPKLVTCGIWRPIGLRAWDDARLADVAIRTDLHDPAKATLDVTVSAETDGVPLVATTTVTLAGEPVATVTAPLDAAGNGRVAVPIARPQLWWPNGMGEHPLYGVRVELKDAAGAVVDRQDRRVGLRTVELVRKSAEHPMGLVVNGRPFFAKGANCIPLDMFPNRVTPARRRQMVADAAAAHMNTLRFWGGGHYEEDDLFDACDELGLVVWEEFKFACSAYPAYDPAFLDTVRAEAGEQVRRLRDHPSLAVWSGNNEVSYLVSDRTAGGRIGRADYALLFDDAIGGAVRTLAPGAVYVIGSPGPAGDDHNWFVWHVGHGFAKYEQSHGFTSEFGFQSFPCPATVAAYTDPGDRASLTTPVMTAHQHNGSGPGNVRIAEMSARLCRPPRDVDSALWVSQIVQAIGVCRGVEYWRSDWPRSTGSLVWQLDDCWPGPTWSTVDYYGRWKAAQYRLAHSNGPVMVTATTAGTVARVACCSDLIAAARGKLTWAATDTAGAAVPGVAGAADVSLAAGTAAVLGPTVTVPDASDLLWLTLAVDGQPPATKLVTFAPPKRVPLTDPRLAAAVEPAGDGFDVTVTAARPAMFAWLDVAGDPDARYSDNFVDLRGDAPLRIHLTPSRPTTAEQMRQRLRVRSLFDTYDPAAVPPPPPVVVAAADGTVRATADTATVDGESAHLETHANGPANVGRWDDAGDTVRWTARLPAGRYRVAVELACPKGTDGSTYAVDVGTAHVTGTVPATRSWDDYRTVALGTVTVVAAGDVPVVVRPVTKPGENVMNLRSVTLTPVRE